MKKQALESRPKWSYDINHEWFDKHADNIVEVRHRWKMTGPDTSEDWVEVKTENSNWSKVPETFEKYFEYRPNYRSLFVLTYNGQAAAKISDQIIEYDEEHQEELNEYLRLKAKFGG